MSDIEKRRGSAWKWVLGAVAALVVLLGAVYVAAYFVTGDRLPAKAAVDGVPIGGMSPEEATEKLQAELEPVYAQPITLSTPDGGQVAIEPLSSGFTLDFEASVNSAGGGFSWNPLDMIDTFTGGGDNELVVDVDRDQLVSTLEADAPAFATEPVDATLAYEDAEIATTDAVNGTALQAEETAENVEEAFFEYHTEADAALEETEPAVTDAVVEQAVSSFAAPAISGPVTITTSAGNFQVTPAQIAGVTTFEAADGELVPQMDPDELMTATADARSSLDLGKAKDASYRMSDGKIVVIPAVEGRTMEPDALVAAVKDAAVKEGDERTAAVELVTESPDFTTADAEKVVPNQVIGEFTTYYPPAAYRDTNIGTAARKINGSVLLPGKTFSMNDTVGERTPANGFAVGSVIDGGVLVQASGGGVSQVATTLFNAAMFAGLEDVEHKPHSLYFDRYPAGREATVYYGSVDLRFKNDTDYPVYIQGYINPSSSGNRGSVTFKMWSRPTWTKIEVTDATKSGFYSGTIRTMSDSECKPQAPIQGFTAKWSRTFYRGTEAVKTEDFTWKYNAGDRIVCE